MPSTGSPVPTRRTGEKNARDRLSSLAQTHPDWALGYLDEVWWSRFAQPTLSTWTEAESPLHLVEQTRPKEDPDPKALACYGLLARLRPPDETPREQMWLRFVQGRPVSAITTQFLAWCASKLEREGKKALLVIWDNASWQQSQQVRGWLRDQNRPVQTSQRGVRSVPCFLPTKSPWLNPIEPKWVHGKRAIVEPAALLSAHEVAERVCAYFDCPHEAHLFIPEKVA